MNLRRGRHNTRFRDRALADFAAERHGVTSYDAAYLEVALRLGPPLATLDQYLLTATTAKKVQLLGE